MREGITDLAIGVPPIANGVAGKLAGIAADANLDVAHVSGHVVEPVGNCHPSC